MKYVVCKYKPEGGQAWYIIQDSYSGMYRKVEYDKYGEVSGYYWADFMDNLDKYPTRADAMIAAQRLMVEDAKRIKEAL